MTARTVGRTDLAALDRHIMRALAALRCARLIVLHSGSAPDRHNERRAEANLNALLEYRYAASRRAEGRPSS